MESYSAVVRQGQGHCTNFAICTVVCLFITYASPSVCVSLLSTLSLSLLLLISPHVHYVFVC